MRKWLVVLSVMCGSSTYALTSVKNSCQIIIQLDKKNGESQTVQFESKLKSKAECKVLAHIHRRNFEPNKIRTKRVTFVWKQTRKSIPILAKADTHSKRHAKLSRKLRRTR